VLTKINKNKISS